MKSAAARILVFTGDGKGKTTAAIGLALRSLAYGKRAFLAQFCKKSPSGEVDFLAKMPGMKIIQSSQGMTPAPGHPDFPLHVQAAGELFAAAVAARDCDTIILDEICVAASRGLIPLERIVSFALSLEAEKTLVMTGRDAPPDLIAVADTVTGMSCLKHAFARGLAAQAGVEF